MALGLLAIPFIAIVDVLFFIRALKYNNKQHSIIATIIHLCLFIGCSFISAMIFANSLYYFSEKIYNTFVNVVGYATMFGGIILSIIWFIISIIKQKGKEKIVNMEEVKKENMEVKKNKKRIAIIGITILIIAISVGAITLLNGVNNNTIKGQFDNLLKSSDLQVIFFDNNTNEAQDFKNILDTDLKEHGVTYTTIDMTNASYEDLEHIKLKLNISSGDFNYYIVAIRGSENLFFLDYSSIDRTMLLFANNGLLNDNQGVLNEYHYNLGTKALENGNIGAAKDHLEKVVNYKDEKELLKDKRFYLVGNEYKYTNGNEGLSGRHLDITFKYYGGSDYSDDWVYSYVWDCELPYGCLYSTGNSQSWDAKMISNNKVLIREFQANDNVPFNNSLNIEILSETKIKLGYNGNYYTLTKTN